MLEKQFGLVKHLEWVNRYKQYYSFNALCSLSILFTKVLNDWRINLEIERWLLNKEKNLYRKYL